MLGTWLWASFPSMGMVQRACSPSPLPPATAASCLSTAQVYLITIVIDKGGAHLAVRDHRELVVEIRHAIRHAQAAEYHCPSSEGRCVRRAGRPVLVVRVAGDAVGVVVRRDKREHPRLLEPAGHADAGHRLAHRGKGRMEAVGEQEVQGPARRADRRLLGELAGSPRTPAGRATGPTWRARAAGRA
jgi:hypothetical protein